MKRSFVANRRVTFDQRLSRHLLRIFCVWAFLAVIVATFAAFGIRMSKLSRDPAEIANVPFYYGLLSNLGILAWAAGAFTSLFASFHVDGTAIRSLLRWAGILTAILLIDDFLLIHDEVFPKVLGLPEWSVYIFYLAAFPLFFYVNLDTILMHTEYRVLGSAVFLLGVSVLVDVHLLPGGIDVEDGLKLCGIVVYAYYWIFTSHYFVAQSTRKP